MDGLGILLIHGVAHFVARQTEVHRVGVFHEGVEAAPEDDPADRTHDEDDAQSETLARIPKELPQPAQDRSPQSDIAWIRRFALGL